MLVYSDQPLVLHFLSLATGEIHPLVTEPLKCPKFETPIASSRFVVTIIGDLVGLLGGDVCFFICNWKTGKLYIECDLTSSKDLDSFFFLDQDTFVLPFTNLNRATLKVYKLQRTEGQSLESSLIAVYLLPTLTPGTVVSVESRSDPPPRSYSPYTSNPRFTTSPYSVRLEERIIILSLDMVRGENLKTVLLITRAETLVNIPEAAFLPGGGAAIVTPEMWMDQTRMLPDIIPPEQWMCYCYGSRLVIPICGPAAAERETKWATPLLLDFNPRLAAWVGAERKGAPWDPSSPFKIHLGTNQRFSLQMGEKDEFFEDDWISGLPFTVISSHHMHNLRRTEDIVLMIDDKRMMALKVRWIR
jgi:hypothetical protein